MSDNKARKVKVNQTKIRDVPVAVTPEGFWCCPSQVAFQKSVKNQNHQNKHKPESPPVQSKASIEVTPNKSQEMRVLPSLSRSKVCLEDLKCLNSSMSITGSAPEKTLKPNDEIQQKKILVGFGQTETSDLKVNISGKEGIIVRMSVHRTVLTEKSKFFADKLCGQSPVSYIEIDDCDDVEIFVETVGLMYCKEVKHKLAKQSVPRVLRIFKVAESLGFNACIKSCLEYLEAVPWVGEEEENVISSVKNVRYGNYGISPILKRISSDICSSPSDTLACIMKMVLKSNDDRGRREMKSLLLKLLRENSLLINDSVDISIDTVYTSCQSCLNSLLSSFKQAAEPGFSNKSFECKDAVVKQVVLEADNLLWLLEILADRRNADEFAVMWANQEELAKLHPRLPITSRHMVSYITAQIFVGIGKGEMLPLKGTRQLLLNVWLQPLIDDYYWLQHSCRSFDRKVVEEGIGQTILTLPLDDQQSIMLSWLGSFLKVGHKCPNLQRAFEVWWRRTFIRPYEEQHSALVQLDQN